MGAVLHMTVELHSTTCHECGIEFAMPAHRMRTVREGKETLYCPNGHGAVFAKSEAEKLREQLAAANAEKDRQTRLRVDAEATRDHHLREREKAEKKLHRAKNGVCPCCKRSFTALRRHMTTKHPGWKP